MEARRIDRAGDIREQNLHFRRHAHAVEVLLPVACSDRIVHEHDESDIEWLAPADDDLAVYETIVDAVERDRHYSDSDVVIDALPFSAALRAAPAGSVSA